MSFNLSVVNVIDDANKDAINETAALFGCGENNMSVKLVDSAGNVFWGCHSWWKPEDYQTFTDPDVRQSFLPENLLEALPHLYERLVLDGDAKLNWQEALRELDLVRATPEPVEGEI